MLRESAGSSRLRLPWTAAYMVDENGEWAGKPIKPVDSRQIDATNEGRCIGAKRGAVREGSSRRRVVDGDEDGLLGSGD